MSDVMQDAPESEAKSYLLQLLTEAEDASSKMGHGNPNRDLLLRMSGALVALAQQAVELRRRLDAQDAESKRIILP